MKNFTDFIANAGQQLLEIRIQRFLAELRLQLENALGYNQHQQIKPMQN